MRPYIYVLALLTFSLPTFAQDTNPSSIDTKNTIQNIKSFFQDCLVAEITKYDFAGSSSVTNVFMCDGVALSYLNNVDLKDFSIEERNKALSSVYNTIRNWMNARVEKEEYTEEDSFVLPNAERWIYSKNL